jgi:tetratricopeptide (TPR) repeat protein
MTERLGAWLCALALAASGCVHGAGQGTPLSPREQAQLFLQKGQPERAYPLLEELHAQSPGDLDAARMLADAAVRTGRAEALLAKVDADKRAPQAVRHYLRGLLFFARSADAGGPAIREFEQAIALAPDTAEYHYRLGLALLESEKYAQALPPLRRASELSPKRPGLYLPLAKALARTGDTRGAVAALGKLVAQEPTPAEVATARALMDQMADPFAGVPKAAERKLEQGLAWLRDADVPQQAIVTFEELLRDYPDLPVVHALLGLAYQRIDDAGRAVDEFKRAIELAPEVGRTWFYLGELYLARQRPEQAREAFEKAVALNPLLDDAYLRLGDLELERRDVAQARDHFRILTALQPESAPARGKLALALQLMGDYPAADRELRKVLDKDPENVEFMLRLGLLHAERHLRASQAPEREKAASEASRWLRKVLEAQPDNALASRTLDSLKESRKGQ